MLRLPFFIKGYNRFFLPNTDVTRRRIPKRPRAPGQHVTAVEKMQGLKKGEHQVVWAELKFVSIEHEPLGDIISRPYRNSQVSEVTREGFPELTPEEFVEMVIRQYGRKKMNVDTMIERIQYVHVRSGATRQEQLE